MRRSTPARRGRAIVTDRTLPGAPRGIKAGAVRLTGTRLCPYGLRRMDSSAPPALHCARCGAAVAGTRHTRTGHVVGYYLLRPGRTDDAAVRRRDDEAPITYPPVLAPVGGVRCRRC